MALLSALPSDTLYEILARLPAKDLCRLRAVCRAWRSMLSDWHFIAAHATRHPEPLIVLGYKAPWHDGVLYDIMNLSGRVVKRVHSKGGTQSEQVVCTQPDLICVVEGSSMRYQLLNLATGAVHDLPEGLASEHAAHAKKNWDYWVSIAFGLVPSTGKYKVLRLVKFDSRVQLCELFTIDGSSQAHWREKQAPPYHVELRNRNSVVVINGVVYFLLADFYLSATQGGLVGSFDLETEKWSASIQGPFSRLDDDCDSYIKWTGIIIAALSGCLVLGCRTPSSSLDSPSMDLWFLRDFEKGLWVKQHSIKISVLHAQHIGKSVLVLVLNDGRIANHIGNWAFLKIYNHEIDSNFIGVLGDGSVVVGLYGGSLLSLANGTS